MLKQSEHSNVFEFSMTAFVSLCVQKENPLRPKSKYSTSKNKMFYAQEENVLRPTGKCSTPNRKMFYVQEENVPRPKSKSNGINKKSRAAQENALHGKIIPIQKDRLLKLRKFFHILFAKVKICSAFFCFRAEFSVIFD